MPSAPGDYRIVITPNVGVCIAAGTPVPVSSSRSGNVKVKESRTLSLDSINETRCGRTTLLWPPEGYSARFSTNSPSYVAQSAVRSRLNCGRTV